MSEQPHKERWEFGWAAWLCVVVLGSFAVFEGKAIQRKEPTLSQTVWNVTRKWPPFGWLTGLAVGFLGAHFFWPNQGPD